MTLLPCRIHTPPSRMRMIPMTVPAMRMIDLHLGNAGAQAFIQPLRFRSLCRLNGFEDDAARFCRVAHMGDLCPFSGLEILVVGEEMLHAVDLDVLDVADIVDLVVHGGELVDRYGEDFFIPAAV